ncbi:hypothetical protein ACFL4D_01250 [Candidatus Margulisiibacteriota bacterium]
MEQHPAEDLYNSVKEWKRFFITKYRGPQFMFRAAPGYPALSKAKLLEYYLHFHPQYYNSRNWEYAIAAYTLRTSGPQWEKFFKRQYKTPLQLLESIPEGATGYPRSKLLKCYTVFHPKTQKKPPWSYMATAATLAESSPRWASFFAGEYVTVQEFLDAIPESATQSIVTLARYYEVFHKPVPQRGKARLSNAACAMDMIRADARWRVFFNTIYAGPGDFLRSIPKEIIKISLLTVLQYYLALHIDMPDIKTWGRTVHAYLFYEQHKKMVNEICRNILTIDKAMEIYKIKVTTNILQGYIDLLRKHGLLDAD